MQHIWSNKENDPKFWKRVCDNKEIVYENLLRDYKILKEELREERETLAHRDTILSIMYDLVRNKEVTDERKIRIIRKVIDVESGAVWTYKRKDEDVENFFKRIFKPYL